MKEVYDKDEMKLHNMGSAVSSEGQYRVMQVMSTIFFTWFTYYKKLILKRNKRVYNRKEVFKAAGKGKYFKKMEQCREIRHLLKEVREFHMPMSGWGIPGGIADFLELAATTSSIRSIITVASVAALMAWVLILRGSRTL